MARKFIPAEKRAKREEKKVAASFAAALTHTQEQLRQKREEARRRKAQPRVTPEKPVFKRKADTASAPQSGARESGMLRVVLIAVILVMTLAGAYLLPSGKSVAAQGESKETRSAMSDITKGIGVIAENVANEALKLPKVYLLPMTMSKGKKPLESGYSSYKDSRRIKHYTYTDPTITVDCWKERVKVGDVRAVANFAKVKIAHPTQFRSSFSGKTYGSKTRRHASKIAKAVNAVVAINGDFYTLRDEGIFYRQGTLYRKKVTSRNTLFVDSDGDFHIMPGSVAESSGFLDKYTIYNSYVFGPALVVDGKVKQYKWSPGGLPAMHFGRNPRTALGQTGKLEYLFVTVDGRSTESRGLTTNQMAKLMKAYGCIHAYNLDGGQSSTMVFHNQVFNVVSNKGERGISDIVYFASALPQ